ncbi:MAG: histidine kinase [Bacteroidia bacterium]|nr:histidine kinase [Bacteroidia bacterium]
MSFEPALVSETEQITAAQLEFEEAVQSHDTAQIIASSRKLSNKFRIIGNYPLAIKYGYISLRTSEKTNDVFSIGKARISLGNAYHNFGDYANARRQFLEARDTSTDQSQHILLNIYLGLGNVERLAKNFELSHAYYSSALDIWEEMHPGRFSSTICGNLAKLYTAEKNFSKAFVFHDSCFNFVKKINNLYGVSGSYSEMAQMFLDSGDYKSALKLAKLGLSAASKGPYLEHVKEDLRILQQCYFTLGDTNLAAIYLKRYVGLKDSLYNVSQINLIRQTEIERNRSEQEAKTAYLEQQNQLITEKRKRENIIWTSLVLALLLVALVIILVRKNKLRQLRIRLITTEQKWLQSQMNPHFIFNALSGIQTLLYQKKSDLAQRYLTHFSRLVRKILDGSRKELISIESEIEQIKHYLDIQRMRLGNEVSFTLEVDPDIEKKAFVIPPMFCQPLIENAIEHGVKNLENRKGHVRIHFFHEADTLIVAVSDNGNGINTSQLEEKQDSIALVNMTERIRLLNRFHRTSIVLEVDSQANQGTNVILKFAGFDSNKTSYKLKEDV